MKKSKKLLSIGAASVLSLNCMLPVSAAGDNVLKSAIKNKRPYDVICFLQRGFDCKNMSKLLIENRLWNVFDYLFYVNKIDAESIDEAFTYYVYEYDDKFKKYPFSLDEFIYLTDHGYITDVAFHLFYICKWGCHDIQSYISKRFPDVTLDVEDIIELINESIYRIK